MKRIFLTLLAMVAFVACNNTDYDYDYEFEIADGQVQELKPYFGYNDNCYSYTFAFDTGLTGEKQDTEVEIIIKLTEPDTNKTAYESRDSVKLTDFEKSLINSNYYEIKIL